VVADQGLDPVMNLRIWIVRQMLQHRNITLPQVSEALGCSVRWLRDILNNEGGITDTRRVLWLNDIEDYITEVSDAKGQVPSACCGQEAYLDYVDLITKGTMDYGSRD
jgi:hypothetical protein